MKRGGGERKEVIEEKWREEGKRREETELEREASSEICANWFCQTSTERRVLLLLDLLHLGWQIYASC